MIIDDIISFKGLLFKIVDYLVVKEKYFVESVGSATIISSYEKNT